MKLFPFARARSDLMHMRIAAISPFRFVPNVWGIFRGTFRAPEHAFDFVGPAFRVELLNGARPFQQSGDAMGDRDAAELRVAGVVRLVDLLAPPRALPEGLLAPRREAASEPDGALSSPAQPPAVSSA